MKNKLSLLEENLGICEQENNFIIPKGGSRRNAIVLKTKHNQPKNKSSRKKNIAKYQEFILVYSEVVWALCLVKMKESHITENMTLI